MRRRPQRTQPPRLGLGDFGLRERARAIGALALWPGTADRWEAIQALAATSRSHPSGGRRMTHTNLTRWLATPEAAALHAHQASGIYDGEWVTQGVVHSAGRTILGGRVRRPRQIVETVADTLATLPQTPWVTHAWNELDACLTLGAVLAERAALLPATTADHRHHGQITLPDPDTWTRLRHAVTFDHADLSAAGLSPPRLAHLCRPLLDRTDGHSAARDILPHPISATARELIVIAAPQLTGAGVDRTLTRADGAGQRVAYLNALALQTQLRTTSLLTQLGFTPQTPWRSGQRLLRFDTDKLAHVTVICDGQPGIGWDAQPQIDQALAAFTVARQADPQVAIGLIVTLSAGGWPLYDAATRLPVLAMGLDELEVLADTYRSQPLFLWHLLDEGTFTDLALTSSVSALDITGLAERRYSSSILWVSPDPALDAAEEQLLLARETSHRQVAPDPDNPGQAVTVLLARDVSANDVYRRAGTDTDRVELFVTVHGQSGWVRAAPDTDSADPAGAIATLIARWLSVIWRRALFAGLDTPCWRLDVTWSPSQPERLVRAGSTEPAGIAVTQLTIGPPLLHELSELTNAAARELVRAALDGWLEACGTGSAGREVAAMLTDQTLPADAPSPLVWPSADAPRMTERLAPVPEISPAGLFRARAEIADAVRRRHAPGHYTDTEAHAILNLAVQEALDAIAHGLANLNDDVVRSLVELHERAVTDEFYDGLTLPARAALYGDEIATDEYRVTSYEHTRTTLGLRFLIEHVAARSPAGSQSGSAAALERLRALADFVLDGGGLSDAVWQNLVEIELLLRPDGPIGINPTDELSDAQQAQMQAWHHDAPQRHRELTAQILRPDPPSSPAFTPEPAREPELAGPVDEAWQRTYGYTHMDMARACSRLIAAADARSDSVIAMSRTDAIGAAATDPQISPTTAARVIDALTLEPPETYNPGTSIDQRPWRLRRTWSLVSCPIIRWHHDGHDHLLWGAETLSKHGLYRTRLEQNGYGIKDPTLKQSLGSVRQERDREFNDAVAAIAAQIDGATVSVRVIKLGGRRLSNHGQDIGDIDVLVAIPSAGQLLALETKNFVAGLNAFEIASELRRLAAPRGPIAQHTRRLAWLKENSDAATQTFGAPTGGGWALHGAIVVPAPLAAAFLGDLPLPILAASELVGWAVSLSEPSAPDW